MIKLSDNSDSSSCASNADAKDLIMAEKHLKKCNSERQEWDVGK